MATTTTTTKYGAPVSLSVQRGIRSKYKSKIGLAYPVTRITTVIPAAPLVQNKNRSVTYFGKSKGLELIKNNLTQLIKTEKGERLMLPDYGLGLSRYLFEPLDEVTYDLIKRDILYNIHRYFSIGRVITLSIFSQDLERDRNQLIIRLTMQLLDASLDIFDIEAKVG